MNLLCRIGLHKMRDLQRGSWNGVTQEVTCKCLRCGEVRHLLLISPLSGPRKAPMHPDAYSPSRNIGESGPAKRSRPDWSRPLGEQSIPTLGLAVDELNKRVEALERERFFQGGAPLLEADKDGFGKLQ